MYVLTSNPELRARLPQGTYGNMSFKNSRGNYLGVGVDYRTVYGTIMESLFGINADSYFGIDIDLEKEISSVKNKVSLLSHSYQVS
jgi:hypothetical protein